MTAWARPLSKFKITSHCESSLQATMARGHCRHEVVNLHLNSKMAQNAECIYQKGTSSGNWIPLPILSALDIGSRAPHDIFFLDNCFQNELLW